MDLALNDLPTATAAPTALPQHPPPPPWPANGRATATAPDTTALMPVAHKPAAVFTHGRGSWLWDSEGRSHLDLVQGWAVNTLGHAPPEISAALATQSQRLLQPGPGLHNDRAAALAQRLAQLTGLHHAFFTSSGAEANEGAVKLARRYGQKHRGGAFEVITFDNSFHGRTLAMMSASGKPGFDSLFAPGVPGFPKARLNDLASVQALVNERTAAVMVEPIQGEAGVLEAQPEFLLGLRRLCDAHGLLLIFDEVQTGVGRTGRLWGFEHSGVRPDVMTLGKGLGGGVPIGALLASEAASCFNLGDQGGTYNGNPLVCAVALAVLEVVTASGFLQQVRERGVQLREGLADLGRRVGGGPVSGQGLLLALPLAGAEQASNAAVALLARASVSRPGLLVNAVRPNRLRFAPALNVQPNELNLGLALLATAL